MYIFNSKQNKIENEKLSACDFKRRFVRVKEPQKAVFFDRDGTLHVDKVETTLDKGLEIFPDTIQVLKEVKRRGYRIIIITNQSGIAKGHITLKQMHKLHKALRRRLARKLCFIDAIYYCPHQKSDHCRCAKPGTGMFDRAQREFHIDISKSYIVGDKIGDIKADQNAGIPKDNWLLVTTGIYENNDYRTEPGIDELEPRILSNLSEVLAEVKKLH